MVRQTAEEEFRQVLETNLASGLALLRGDVAPTLQLYSRRDDVTLLGAAGGCTVGGAEAAERLAWVASQSRGGTMSFEYVTVSVTDEMAYTVYIQHGDQLFAGTDKPMASELRVTEIYRREADGWKIVHRHADPLVHLNRQK